MLRGPIKKSRWIPSAILVLMASLALASAVLYNYAPGLGYLIGPTSISPTATYTGQMGVSFQGVYHYLTAVPKCRHNWFPCVTPDEVVFYLETDTTIIRLILYCGVVSDFCTRADQLPFSEGAVIYVKGTLIEPSKWPANEFEPYISFNADLYVFQHNEIQRPMAHGFSQHDQSRRTNLSPPIMNRTLTMVFES